MTGTDRRGFDALRHAAREAMIDHGLLPEFSADVMAQLQIIAAGTATSAQPGSTTRDLRELLWASIDNDDSMDLDQLEVAQPLADGATRILVAIADVDATVGAGTAIDTHARANTTSVYTAVQIFPMLPDRLSTDLTSLAAGQERHSIVVELTIDAAGAITQSQLYRALVCNRAKLAYNSVAAWLSGTGPAPAALAAVPGMDEQLRMQDRVAQQLKHIRHARGALSLETTEARAVFNDAVLSDLRADEPNRAKELIEEFMIAANSVAAQYLEQRRLPSIRRVLRTPERWPRIVALAGQFNEQLPATPDALALNTFLGRRRIADPARFPDLSLSVVKLLGAGEYVLKHPGQSVPGHFGLALQDYAHSTAPNRRFPDLILQRLLKAALDSRPSPYADEALATMAAHCTAQEANANKVERQVRKCAAALLLAPRIGQQFDGIVTGASDKGTWVRITEPVAEGRVMRGHAGLDVGDHVRVRLTHTDTVRGFIDFERS